MVEVRHPGLKHTNDIAIIGWLYLNTAKVPRKMDCYKKPSTTYSVLLRLCQILREDVVQDREKTFMRCRNDHMEYGDPIV